MAQPWEVYGGPDNRPGPWKNYAVDPQLAPTSAPAPAEPAPPPVEKLPGIAGDIDDIVRSLASGVTLGFADEIAAAGNSAFGSSTYDESLTKERARDESIYPGIRIPGEIAGMVAANVLTGGGASLPQAIGQGAAYGFGSGEGGFANRAESAAYGAAGGALGHVGAKAVSNVIAPVVRPAVTRLMKSGVTPTPGQVIGGGARSIESKLSSVPIMGEAIHAGERRAVEQFNVAALNHALAPLKTSLPQRAEAGRASVEEAGKIISKGYDEVLPNMGVRADSQFLKDFKNLTDLADDMVPARATQFRKIIATKLREQFSSNGSMTGEGMKKATSELGRLASDFMKAGDADQRMLGLALLEAQQLTKSMAARQNPQYAEALKALDDAYARFLRVEVAAARIGAKEGIFSPAQLNSAVREMDKSLRHRSFARGNAKMQGFASDAEDVLGGAIPDSGTAGRAALQVGALAAGGGAINPLLGASVLAGAAPYTPIGQRAVANMLTNRPTSINALAEMLRKGAPAAGFGGAALAVPGQQ